MRFFSRKDPIRNYLNKAIIGLGVGLVRSNDLLLNPDFGPQGTMDVLGVWIGQEIVKEMMNQKKIKAGISERELVKTMLEEIRLAEELNLDFTDNSVNVTIQDCMICPKRVGGYDLGKYTACPVGGILLGALSYVRGETPSLPKINLKPGQYCSLELNLKN
ncbi:MAG: hypothetical protein ACFFD1_10095 [Candidatus Thorarchaeota archaeon]